jgi:hypothetical protein
MKAYKGFDKNMKCRGFQFEAGKDYEEDRAKLCVCGFHACTNPIDVLQYYGPATSIYREVELEGVCKDREKDSKVCAKKIHIGAELSLSKMIKLGVDIDIKSAKKPTSGDYSHAATSGDYSPAATSGNSSHAATSGDYSHAATSGDSSHAATSGQHSIAAAIGRNGKAKSTLGNWIVLAEYGDWNGECHPVSCVKTGLIDGETLKPDVWYELKDGEFMEVNDNA